MRTTRDPHAPLDWVSVFANAVNEEMQSADAW
jgi:hypothetical protein